MIDLPTATYIGRILPKEAFYKKLVLSTDLKERFVSDIKRITLENSLTADNLHLNPTNEISEILVLSFELKKKDYDNKILESITKQNDKKLLFIIRFDSLIQFALYYNKLYKTEWNSEDQAKLDIQGFSLDEIWNNLVEQIAIMHSVDIAPDKPLPERLKRQQIMIKLQREIDRTEKAAHREKQPKKKFELAMKVNELKKELKRQSGG